MVTKVNGRAVPKGLKLIGIGVREIPRAKVEGEDEILHLLHFQVQFAPHTSSIIETKPKPTVGTGAQIFFRRFKDGPKEAAARLRELADALDKLEDGQAPTGDRVDDNDEDSPCPAEQPSTSASTH